MSTIFSPVKIVIGTVTGTIGPLVLRYMEPLLEWFRQDNVAPTLAALMVGVAFLILVGYRILQIRPVLATLNARIRFIKKLEQKNEAFGEFDVLMRQPSFLKHGWEQFYATILRPEDPKIKNDFEMTIRPSVFINLEDAEHMGLHLKWIGHLSSIFIGIGLLLTFFGLVAALALASDAINQVVNSAATMATDAQSNQIQAALAELLKTASFKFWTSIAGLASGIIIGICERRWLGLVNGKFDELNREIERVIPTATSEMIAKDTLSMIKKQSAHLEDFTTQFRFNMTQTLEDALIKLTNAMPTVMNSAIAGAISDKMPEVMSEAMSPVIDNLKRMTATNTDALLTMTGEVGAAVEKTASREMKAVAEAMTALPVQIAGVVGDLRNATISMTASMSHIVEAANQDVDKTRDTLNSQLQSASQSLADTAQAIKDSLEQVGQTMRNNTKEAGLAFAGEIAAAIAHIGEAARDLREGSHKSTEDITAKFLQAAVAMQDAVNNNTARIGEAVERIVSASNQAEVGVGKAADDVGKMLERRGTDAAEQVTHGAAKVLTDLMQHSTASMQGMKDITEQMTQSVKEIIHDLREESSKSANDITAKLLAATTKLQQAFNDNTACINVTVEQIVSAGNRAGNIIENKGIEAANRVMAVGTKALIDLETKINLLWMRIDNLSKILATAEIGISSHVSALAKVTQAARDTETALSSSANSLTNATQPLTQTGKLLTNAMDSIVESVRITTQGLGESQAQARQLADSLQKTTQELQELWKRHVQRFDGVDDKIGKVFSQVIKNTDTLNQQLTEYVQAIDQHVANISNKFAGNVEELSDLVGELVKHKDSQLKR